MTFFLATTWFKKMPKKARFPIRFFVSEKLESGQLTPGRLGGSGTLAVVVVGGGKGDWCSHLLGPKNTESEFAKPPGWLWLPLSS